MTIVHRQHRALEWLHHYGRRYPWAWETYAQLQADPPAEWPSWCWMPLAGTYAVLSGGGDNRLLDLRAQDVGVLGGLAAWRATQGIYRVHPTLLGELLETPVSGDLPSDVLTRLPEWCVYVETPGAESITGGNPLAGFWAYLEHDANTGRAELRLILDCERAAAGVVPPQVTIHLGGTIEDGIRAMLRESRIQALRAGLADVAPPSANELDQRGLMAPFARQIGALVSVLLYLCADEAEIEERRELPPRVVTGKKRPICPAAKAPVIHPAGYRIGAALDFARKQASEGAGGGGWSVASHVRRAHWHRFWVGPRDGERRVVLRWLSPILVAADNVPESATVRHVGDT